MRLYRVYGFDTRINRKMTRSAPPERTAQSKHTSGSGRHTAYQRAQKSKSKSDVSAISVEDIYQFAERERLNYSASNRLQNLAHAQSQTQFFRHEQSMVSRPNTSASRHMNSSLRENCTPFSAWSEPTISRPSSNAPNPELRDFLENGSRGADDDDEEEDIDYDDYRLSMAQHTPMTVTFSPVGRDCCEIIGPQLCYECRKNRIREVSRQRSDGFFPVLEPSEENLTTAAIVRKYLPGLSEPEIETKLARGEIARPAMFRKSHRHVDFDDETDAKPKQINKKVTIVENNEDTDEKSKQVTQRVSELFFTNIRDLNNKIISGNVDRNVGFSEAARKLIQRKDKTSLRSHFPTFVSPRKVTMVQKTNYKTYFEPPLIEKAKQDVEPAFFAGSKNEYVLPEKLPDELVFIDKDGNEVKASSSQGFTDKMSATEELSGKKGKTKGGAKSIDKTDIGQSNSLGALKEDEEEEADEGNVDKLEEDFESDDESHRSEESVNGDKEKAKNSCDEKVTEKVT